MAGFSTQLALDIFNATLKPTTRDALSAKASVYMSLHTAAPSDTTGGSEAAYTSYARQSIGGTVMTLVADSPATGQSRASNVSAAVTFPASTGGGDATITHWAIWDHVSSTSGANLMYSGAFTSSRVISTGDVPVVAISALTIDFT